MMLWYDSPYKRASIPSPSSCCNRRKQAYNRVKGKKLTFPSILQPLPTIFSATCATFSSIRHSSTATRMPSHSQRTKSTRHAKTSSTRYSTRISESGFSSLQHWLNSLRSLPWTVSPIEPSCSNTRTMRGLTVSKFHRHSSQR